MSSLKKVIRYTGPKTRWNEHIISGDWKDCIVFGKVEDPSLGQLDLIYAGKDETEEDPDYKFESLSDLKWQNDIDESMLPHDEEPEEEITEP